MNHKRLIPLTTCFILSVVPGLSVLSFAVNESETNAEAEQHYEKAYELRKATDYDAAIAEYEKVMSLSPNSKIAQNAHYWIGQSHFEARQFDAALSAFQGLLDKYPTSSIAPSAKQMIEQVQQAKINKALFEAVKTKADVEQVKLLITEGADVDAKWVDVYNKNEEETSTVKTSWRTKRTPLLYAVTAGKIEVVKALVEAGADVNAGGWPPLCQAVDYVNTDIAEYLIDHGANVNYPKGWGPIQEAATFSLKMVKFLIERGADINGGPWPALHTAISRAKNRDMAELLIQHGADVNAKDASGNTPLYYAILYIDDSDFINLLIANGADVNTKNQGGETPLHIEARASRWVFVTQAGRMELATQAGRTETAKLLLEAGANVNCRDDRDQTPLHRMLDNRVSSSSIYPPSKDMAELLLVKGADVNLKDKDGRTLLHLAAESADADIVKLLLDKGARIDEKNDESGATALHLAARFGNKNVAEVLIARGADINAKDKEDHTPLYVATNHDYKVAELLINKGADSSIKTESGQTLLLLAQQRKEIESIVPDMMFDGEPNSHFGIRAACADVNGDGYDDILIGAYGYNNHRGRVYLFYGGPHIETTTDFIFEGQREGDWFGSGIACGDIDTDGDEEIVIGAGRYREHQGRAYLYWGGHGGSGRKSMDANPDKIFTGEGEERGCLGLGYPAVYDIDNDGYADIILGAQRWTGKAYLYYGNTGELMDKSRNLIFTEDPGHLYGCTISCGDVDNDGYGDIVIGASARPGRAYLYYGGSKSNMDAKADVIFKAQSEGNNLFGCSIVCVDQNRDGYDDVVIGAPGYNDSQGRVCLFYGSSKRPLDVDPDMIFDGENECSDFGIREVCGDIDGDHVNDLVIAASGFGQGVGRVYIYWGNELASPDPKPGRILTGENPYDFFGQDLACGDVNNDGFDDLVVGAYGYKAGTRQGRAYLYYGGPRNK